MSIHENTDGEIDFELHQVNQELSRIREEIDRRDEVPKHLKAQHEEALEQKRDLLNNDD
jgi:hypothetical protein